MISARIFIDRMEQYKDEDYFLALIDCFSGKLLNTSRMRSDSIYKKASEGIASAAIRYALLYGQNCGNPDARCITMIDTIQSMNTDSTFDINADIIAACPDLLVNPVYSMDDEFRQNVFSLVYSNMNRWVLENDLINEPAFLQKANCEFDDFISEFLRHKNCKEPDSM